MVDAYVFAHTVIYDSWDALNPKDFTYTSNYAVPENMDDPMFYGETRAFALPYGMTYAKEDRATLFTAAITADNEALFSSEIMQSKLETMCKAIRKSYSWEDQELTLPWEQYLNVE